MEIYMQIKGQWVESRQVAALVMFRDAVIERRDAEIVQLKGRIEGLMADNDGLSDRIELDLNPRVKRLTNDVIEKHALLTQVRESNGRQYAIIHNMKRRVKAALEF